MGTDLEAEAERTPGCYCIPLTAFIKRSWCVRSYSLRAIHNLDSAQALLCAVITLSHSLIA